MQSFSATFHFLGRQHRVLFCVHEVHQDGNHRAEPQSLVYSDELILTLLVPDDTLDLIEWAYHQTKQVSCSVVFDAPDGLSPNLHLVMENAVCVSYEEHLVPNGQGGAAFTCQLSIVAPRFTFNHVPFDNNWTGALTSQ